MRSFMRAGAIGLVLSGVALASAGQALEQPGSAADPIVLHMRRGTDSIRVHGLLQQGVDCCVYQFAAGSGQRLTVRESGAAARLLLTYPDGHIDGPGLADDTLLPGDGTYRLTVSPDTMADGAFGRFSLKITIPPLGVTPGTSVNGDH